MPESPEVEALALFLRETLTGALVGATEVIEFRALKTRSRPLSELEGATIAEVRRFGKHVALLTDGPALVVSFGRAGWASWRLDGDSSTPPAGAPPVIATIDFPGRGELGFTDPGAWLSLGLSVVDEPVEVAAVAKLGPDPTADAFSPADLDEIVIGRRKQLKALLQEQESLAGIGNAYSDEILHAAQLSPVEHAANLDAAERSRLYGAIRMILGQAFADRRGIPIDRQKAAKVAAMRVHGRTGETCPVCGGVVHDVPGSQGAAQYCPTCQTGGAPLGG
ncbi:DNA-formamidopyrimidine glycosylase family protein [Microbacterium sp. RD1]|uniref:DNA-formamidopyrimidine glycosylase family protein n=1 Tax=Microbacterium sp. RD1 TaxID=3457313 RepID=UPI003FA5B2F6